MGSNEQKGSNLLLKMLNESSNEIAELEISMEGEPETEELSVISGGFGHRTRL